MSKIIDEHKKQQEQSNKEHYRFRCLELAVGQYSIIDKDSARLTAERARIYTDFVLSGKVAAPKKEAAKKLSLSVAVPSRKPKSRR